MESAEVLRSLRDLCLAMKPGDTVPPHREIMQRLDASERSVIWALDELRRQGIIVRRRGARTVVAGEGIEDGSQTAASQKTALGVDNRTVVAIVQPDHAIFDHAMKLLCGQVEDARLALNGRFVRGEIPSIDEFGGQPLGYILFRRDLLPLARALQEAGNRVVLVGGTQVGENAGVPNVCGDQETGGYLVMRHLIDLGHRRIAVSGSDDFLQTRRWQGHQRAINQARKTGIDIQIRHVNFREETTNGIAAVLDGPQAPTAFAAWNDYGALRLFGFLTQLGVRIPQDVSLIGYDNQPEGSLIYPQLSTVDSSIEHQLQTALALLTGPQHPVPNHTVVALPTLIRRDSTAAP